MVDPRGHGQQGLARGAHGMALIASVEEPLAGWTATPRLTVSLPLRGPRDDVIDLRRLVPVQRIERTGGLQCERHENVRVRIGRLVAVSWRRPRHREHRGRVAHGQVVRPFAVLIGRDPPKMRRRRGHGTGERPLPRRGRGFHRGVKIVGDHGRMRRLHRTCARRKRLSKQIVQDGCFRAVGGGVPGRVPNRVPGRRQRAARSGRSLASSRRCNGSVTRANHSPWQRDSTQQRNRLQRVAPRHDASDQGGVPVAQRAQLLHAPLRFVFGDRREQAARGLRVEEERPARGRSIRSRRRAPRGAGAGSGAAGNS